MVQESWPWPGTTIGDAGPYSDNDWDNMWETLYGSGEAPYGNRGVIRNWLNELEVTNPGIAGRVDVGTGAALVHGKFYRNTAMESIVGITPAPGGVDHTWREDTILLRAVWGVTRTIRIYRHLNPADETPYVIPPSNDGAVWHIPLAAVRINNVGTITLITDLRDYVSDLMQPKQLFIRPFEGEGPATRLWTSRHEGVQLWAAGHSASMEFMVPLDFKALVSAHVRLVVGMPGGLPGTFDWTVYTEWGGCNELVDAHTDTDTADDVDGVGNGYILCIDVSGALDSANLLAEDQVGFEFTLDDLGGNCIDVVVLGLDFRYR